MGNSGFWAGERADPRNLPHYCHQGKAMNNRMMLLIPQWNAGSQDAFTINCGMAECALKR